LILAGGSGYKKTGLSYKEEEKSSDKVEKEGDEGPFKSPTIHWKGAPTRGSRGK